LANSIHIGTSGYIYEDWKNYFYPEDLDKKGCLEYYSTIFNTVELNFTYYCFPNPYIFLNLSKKVKEDFVFSVKANSVFTHQRNYSNDTLKTFLQSLRPLSDSGKLGSILFQFPYSFKATKCNFDYLKKICEDFEGFDSCVEFRNICWTYGNKTAELLSSMKMGFCNVDEPKIEGLLPATSISTSDTGYIRFHGRNGQYWWKNEQAYQRYDYMYSQDELLEWIPRVKKINNNTKKTFIYFNNHYKAKAAKSALIFLDLLNSNNITTSQK
jgi:uncharacterized protein YecE (DUF72 family)